MTSEAQDVAKIINEDRARWSQSALCIAKSIYDEASENRLSAEAVVGHLMGFAVAMRHARIDENGDSDNIACIVDDARREGFALAVEAMRKQMFDAGVPGFEALLNVEHLGYYGCVEEKFKNASPEEPVPQTVQKPIVDAQRESAAVRSRIMHVFTSRHDTNDLAEAIEISKTLDWKSRSVTDWIDRREFTQWTANLGCINLIIDRFDGSDKCNLYVWHSNSCGSGDLARKIGHEGSLESAQAAAMMLMQTYCKRAFDTINMLNVSRISKVSERAFKDLNEYRSSDASGFNHFLAGIAVGGSTFINTVVSILGYENDRTPSNP